MTFKNKKNLSHTKKRIKRKNISRCLSGGGDSDPLVYCINSCTLSKTSIANDDIIEYTDDIIEYTSAEIYLSGFVNAVKVFQDFIDIQEARTNLEHIFYIDEAELRKFKFFESFKLSVFKYTEEDPFCYGKICTIKFLNDDDCVFTLSKDRKQLESFRDALKRRHPFNFTTIAHAAANNNSHLGSPSTKFLSINYFV